MGIYTTITLLIQMCICFQCVILDQTRNFQAVDTCEKSYFHTKGTILRQPAAKSLIECGLRCMETPGCLSFDFGLGETNDAVPETFHLCYLFDVAVEECQNLEHDKNNWKYMRIPNVVDETTLETTAGPSLPEWECPTCVQGGCGIWEPVYRMDNGYSTFGTKACFLKQVVNGATVRVSYQLDSTSSTVLRAPIEYVYQSDTSDINFYFAALYSGDPLEMIKTYIAISTAGYYMQTVFMINNDLISQDKESKTVSGVMFMIRRPGCNAYGGPGDFVRYRSGLMNGLTTIDFTDVNNDIYNYSPLNEAESGLHTVHSKGTQDYKRAFQSRWIVRARDNAAPVGLKANGESFRIGKLDDLLLDIPITSEYQILDGSGFTKTLKVGISSAGTSLRNYDTTTGQVWFSDSCWDTAFILDPAITESGDIYDLDVFKAKLENGNSLRVVFSSGSLQYTTSVSGIICGGSECVATLDSLPFLNADSYGRISFNNKLTNGNYDMKTFQISGSTLISGNLSSGSPMEEEIAASYWYMDRYNYQMIYYHSPTEVLLDDISASFMQGCVLRLAFKSMKSLHYLEVDHVLEHTSGYFEIHSTQFPDRKFRKNVCNDSGRPGIYVIVFSNNPVSLKRYARSYDMATSCLVEDVVFEFIKVYALLSPSDPTDGGPPVDNMDLGSK